MKTFKNVYCVQNAAVRSHTRRLKWKVDDNMKIIQKIIITMHVVTQRRKVVEEREARFGEDVCSMRAK